MPQKYTYNKVAVEKEELCLEYWDKTGLQYQRAKQLDVLRLFWSKLNSLQVELLRCKNKPYGIKRLAYGGNGRKLLIDFDSLNPEIQNFLGDPRKAGNPLQEYYIIKTECIDYYTAFKRNGSHLQPREQEQYIVNASVIEAMLAYEPHCRDLKLSLRGSVVGLQAQLHNEVIYFNKYLKANHNVTHNLPSNLSRFKQTVKDFKTNGYYSIIKDPEGKKGQNARKVDKKVLAIIEGLYMNTTTKPNRNDIATSYEGFINGSISVYNPDTGELYNPKEYPELSKSTVTAYLAEWASKVSTHRKRAGNRQTYISSNMPYAQMDLPEYAGSIISIDDRQPPFWYEKNKRMWFYIGLDVASDFISTFVYGKSKEGIILEFYRQMVRNYAEWGFGLPKELECESSLNASFKDTFLKEGRMFEHVKIEANNAQAKIIERRFGTLRNVNEKKHTGWIPRPHARSEHNQAKPGKTEIIPYQQLAQDRLRDIEDWNNSLHRTGKGSRWEYFCNNQHPNMKPINWAAILPFLGIATQTSCHRGYIKLQGRARAIAENGKILTGEPLLEKMRMIEGKDIKVYWLDGNNGDILKALAYYKERLICEVMEMPRFNRAKAERTDKDKEAIKIQSAYKNTIETYARNHANEIVSLEKTDNAPKPERKFKIAGINRYEAKEDYADVEVLGNMHEDDEELIFNPNEPAVTRGNWRDSFN